jgi:hypothetical protein
MGVAISVFSFTDRTDPERAPFLRKEFAAINRLLRQNKYPPHKEPDTRPAGWKPRSYITSFPYECLRHLRRFYENVRRHRRDPKACPLRARRTDAEIAEAESWIADTLDYNFDNNLLVHSITSGYYIPLPTSYPLCGSGFAGNGFLGSSNGLLDELALMAAPLGIVLEEGALADKEHKEVWKACRSATEPFRDEKTAWLALFETATASVQHHTAVVLS